MLSGSVWKYLEMSECCIRQSKTDRRSCAHKQQNLLCVAKQKISDRGRMEVDSASVSEVLGSSSIRAVSPKN